MIPQSLSSQTNIKPFSPNTQNSFNVFMQTLNVDSDWQARIIGKTLTLPKHKDIILSSMTQTTKKWDSLVLNRADFWIVMKVQWYSVFSFLFFSFEATIKRTLGWEHFCHGHDNYFKSTILKVTWYQLFSKFSTITRHIDNGIWKTPYSWKFYLNLLNLSGVNITKRIWAKMPLKLLVVRKSEPVFLKNIAARHFTYYFIFIFLSNKSSFKFNSVDGIIFTTIYLLFYLLILCVSRSSSSASKLFYKNR